MFTPQKIGENVELNDYARVNTFSYMLDCRILYSYHYRVYQDFSIQIPLAELKKSKEKMSQFSKSVYCLKSSILQLILAQG